MDEERVMAADWLARLQAVASLFQREQLAEERLVLVWKRRRSPWQEQLLQEEEDEVWQDLLVDIQEEGEGPQELVLVPEGRGQ